MYLIGPTLLIIMMISLQTLRSFLPAMLDSDEGHIVSVCSIAGKIGCHRLVDYSSSKHAVLGLHDALQQELRVVHHKTGIKTTIVYPFFTNTGIIYQPRMRYAHLPSHPPPRRRWRGCGDNRSSRTWLNLCGSKPRGIGNKPGATGIRRPYGVYGLLRPKRPSCASLRKNTFGNTGRMRRRSEAGAGPFDSGPGRSCPSKGRSTWGRRMQLFGD